MWNGSVEYKQTKLEATYELPDLDQVLGLLGLCSHLQSGNNLSLHKVTGDIKCPGECQTCSKHFTNLFLPPLPPLGMGFQLQEGFLQLVLQLAEVRTG